MNGSPARRLEVEDLVAAYRADLVASGMFASHPVTSVARMSSPGAALMDGHGCRWKPSAPCRSRTGG